MSYFYEVQNLKPFQINIRKRNTVELISSLEYTVTANDVLNK